MCIYIYIYTHVGAEAAAAEPELEDIYGEGAVGDAPGAQALLHYIIV